SQNARARDAIRNGRGREDAIAGAEATEPAEEVVIPTAVEVGPLNVGLNTDHEAGARRELVVVADLAATHEAVAIAVGVGEAEGVDAGHRHNRGQSTQSRWHGEAGAAEGEAVEEVVVLIAIREAVTRVHTDVEAGPGEHRN